MAQSPSTIRRLLTSRPVRLTRTWNSA